MDNDDTIREYNQSLRVLLTSISNDTGNSFLKELGVGDAQIFDDYFSFFFENGLMDQSDFLHDLMLYIKNVGYKSFEETYLIRDKAKLLIDKLKDTL